jgi:hypothetical protein
LYVRILPHRLSREAADTLFIIVLINAQEASGNDAALNQKYSIRKYKKHPVVWIMDCKENNLAPRMFRDNNVETTARTNPTLETLKNEKFRDVSKLFW